MNDIKKLREFFAGIPAEWTQTLLGKSARAALERVEAERTALRAKLEKAERGLQDIATLPTENVNGGQSNATSRLNGGWAVNHARAVLAALEAGGGE